jgi:DNA-binding PadR family transcriptional regulator
MTQATQAVLRVLVATPAAEQYGLQICAETGLPSGTIHPILARLERAGWVESRWEDTDSRLAGRPRRRYYRLSPDGAERANRAIARAEQSRAALRPLRPEPSEGTQLRRPRPRLRGIGRGRR